MQLFKKTAVAMVLALAAGGVLAASSDTGSIRNTKHNLGSTGTGTNNVVDTGEICIFCHTPHGGDNSAAVPLWNKVLTSSVFKTYDQLGTSTYDAAQAVIGSVTLACLTCHDGSQALDNIINAPGSGGYAADGGGINGLGWTWGSAGSVDANGAFLAGPDNGGTNIVNLGSDLTNDHPVSMQYGGGGVSSANPTGPTRDADFVIPLQINGSNRWYVDNTFMAGSMGSIGGGFDMWDFKLYTRDTSGVTSENGVAFANAPEPFVECGSCHDPHLETTTFLRIDEGLNGGASNNGSEICLTCHTK